MKAPDPLTLGQQTMLSLVIHKASSELHTGHATPVGVISHLTSAILTERPLRCANIQGRGQTEKESDMSQLTKSCAWCLIEYTTEIKTSIYCTRHHKDLAKQYRKKLARQSESKARPSSEAVKQRKLFTPIVITGCRLCGHVFVSVYLTQIYCSRRCAERYRKTIDKVDRLKYRELRRSQGFKAKLYWKSNGQCGICHKHIDLNKAYPDLESFSVDHIIPLSKGGSENQDNLQAAHLSCNISKSNL